jgi:hypothetical protein
VECSELVQDRFQSLAFAISAMNFQMQQQQRIDCPAEPLPDSLNQSLQIFGHAGHIWLHFTGRGPKKTQILIFYIFKQMINYSKEIA